MKRILIVDDSSIICKQLESALLEVGKYDITTLSNGREALDFLYADNNIDLIITDLNMPQVTGMELCIIKNSIPELKDIPIFILSIESSSEMFNNAKSVGVKGWILKPLDKNKDDFIQFVKKTLEDS